MTDHPRRALVVDDDSDHAAFIAEITSDCGLDTEVAGGVDEALEMLKAQRYELLVTDIRMPGKDGFQLIEEIKALQPDLAIIAITAFGSVDSAMRAAKIGAADYLSKPFEPARLAVRIRQALDRRQRIMESERLRREVSELLRRGHRQ